MMAEIITAVHASETQHWYTREGKPAYTIKGKNGNERPTTLRDARKLGLLPSVSAINNEGAKPALAAWLQKQVLMAALTLPHVDGESDESWIDRIMADSKEQSRQAADRGTQIHAWIQQGFEGQPIPDIGYEYHMAVRDALRRHGAERETAWKVEHSFASDRFGGKVDLHHALAILDIKTKPTPDKFGLYDEHAKQLAAYRHGLTLPNARCGIIFVSVTPIMAELRWIEEDALQRGWRMFEALLDHWYARTGLEVV